jgi:hypothetical protein
LVVVDGLSGLQITRMQNTHAQHIHTHNDHGDKTSGTVFPDYCTVWFGMNLGNTYL